MDARFPKVTKQSEPWARKKKEEDILPIAIQLISYSVSTRSLNRFIFYISYA